MTGGLDILLVSDTLAEAEEWLALALGWIDPARDRLVRIPGEDGYRRRTALPLPGAAAEEADGDARATLLVRAGWGARADWRATIARAEAAGAVDSATGRLLATGEAGPIDLTPGRIADRITEWAIGPRLHGTGCSALPCDFLWVSARRARCLHAALAVADTIEDALHAFHAGGAVATAKWRNLYLPDIIAYRIADMGSALH